MKASIYHKMAQVEQDHWWFAGRRAIVADFLDRWPLPRPARILELGCGSGGNLELLAAHGRVWAVDNEPAALQYASNRELATVAQGSLPDQLPFADLHFDLIVLLDVLEHVREDEASLQAVAARLDSGGYLLVTVPAHRFLWSAHDDLHHHQRRYGRTELARKVRDAGIRIQQLTFFNTWLFPIVAVVRLLERTRPGKAEADLEIPAMPVNRGLRTLFASERYLLRYLSLPVGVSLLMAGQKP